MQNRYYRVYQKSQDIICLDNTHNHPGNGFMWQNTPPAKDCAETKQPTQYLGWGKGTHDYRGLFGGLSK